MWLHFTHLFWRIIHGMPVLVSSNWANWGIGIGSFLLTEILLFMRTDKQERRKKLLGNILIGVIVALCVQAFLFTWSTVQTVYDDHHDSTGRWNAAVKEKNDLRNGLSERDRYIRSLESKSCPTCPPCRSGGPCPSTPGGPAMPQSPDCRHSMIVQPPDPKFKGAQSAVIVIQHCNVRIEAPFCSLIEFKTADFLDTGYVMLLDESFAISPTFERQGNTVKVCVQSPSLPANHILATVVQGTQKEWPNLVRSQIGSQ